MMRAAVLAACLLALAAGAHAAAAARTFDVTTCTEGEALLRGGVWRGGHTCCAQHWWLAVGTGLGRPGLLGSRAAPVVQPEARTAAPLVLPPHVRPPSPHPCLQVTSSSSMSRPGATTTPLPSASPLSAWTSAPPARWEHRGACRLRHPPARHLAQPACCSGWPAAPEPCPAAQRRPAWHVLPSPSVHGHPRTRTPPLSPPPPPSLQVSLTPLQSSGSHVPGLWAADPDLIGLGPIQNTKWIECPSEARPAIQATTNFASITNPGQKLEAVRRAIIKAFAGHVYGLDEWGNYVHKLEVNDLDFVKGVLMVKRSGDPTYGDYNLMYAVTEVSCGAGLAWAEVRRRAGRADGVMAGWRRPCGLQQYRARTPAHASTQLWARWLALPPRPPPARLHQLTTPNPAPPPPPPPLPAEHCQP